MLKFRTELEFFRSFIYHRSNFSVKCGKVWHKMLNPSVYEKGFRSVIFTQNQSISVGRVIDKNITNGEKCDDETIPDKCSPFNDLLSINLLLKEILKCRRQRISSWLLEEKVNKLCELYACLPEGIKNEFIEGLAEEDNFQKLGLFSEIGKMKKGPGYLVNLRADLINLMKMKKDKRVGYSMLHDLNTLLLELLSIWFSNNYLQLKRVTSKSSNELLEKISKYERVHPVRNWADLMRRVGPYRRCFVFLHHSMPDEPIIILHVALTREISSRVTDIFCQHVESSTEPSTEKELSCDSKEESGKLNAAVFYSLSLAQKGLNGIGMSYYLIQRVSEKIQTEFPGITQFSTLSPVYTFKMWFLQKLEKMKSGHNDILFLEELEKLEKYFKHSNYVEQLEEVLLSNAWFLQEGLCDILQEPFVRLCARYLYLEKTSRGYAADSAAHLHLKNGAVMWRINWRANPHPRGLNSSFGIMVNYRYYINDMDVHGKEYQEEKKIIASEQVTGLVKSAQKLMLNPVVKSKI